MTYRIGVIGTGGGPTGNNIPPAAISEIAGEGFKPELIETRLRTFPMTPYDRGLTAIAYLDCAKFLPSPTSTLNIVACTLEAFIPSP